MQKKSEIHFFLIKDLSAAGANVLKQDALRVGAELVTHKEAILGTKQGQNALLMATKEQIQKLCEKEKKQDFKLKNLAFFLQEFLASQKERKKSPDLMGILNINEDSFNPQSRVGQKDFEARLNELLEQGAKYIDIGAVSSRPGSEYCGAKQEFKRLKFALDLIGEKYHQNAIFSLDSFDEYCLEYALNKGFKLINDITGLKNENLAKLAANYGASYCLMHMQNEPKTMQEKPFYEDILSELYEFFRQKIEILHTHGAKDIILDVGIGFGKTPQHNLILLHNLEHFLSLNKPLLIGASRKSLINFYSPSAVEERLAGSLYLHLKAFENGASIIRTHDIKEHKQLFAMHEAINKFGVLNE